MSILYGLRRPAGNARGSTIVLVALAIAALLSVVALAVDVGMLLNARTEAQRAADSAALAFFESVQGNGNNQRVFARLLFASGIGGGSGSTGAGVMYVHLVE